MSVGAFLLLNVFLLYTIVDRCIDFNEDDLIDAEDIEMIVSRLTGRTTTLTEEEMEQLVKNVSFLS